MKKIYKGNQEKNAPYKLQPRARGGKFRCHAAIDKSINKLLGKETTEKKEVAFLKKNQLSDESSSTNIR